MPFILTAWDTKGCVGSAGRMALSGDCASWKEECGGGEERRGMRAWLAGLKEENGEEEREEGKTVKGRKSKKRGWWENQRNITRETCHGGMKVEKKKEEKKESKKKRIDRDGQTDGRGIKKRTRP